MTLTEALAASSGRLRLLLVLPSPIEDPDRLQPEAEIRESYAALDQLRIDVDVIRLSPPTIDNLRLAIASHSFDIIHIASHGHSTGIDFEEVDGTAFRISRPRFAELFRGCEQGVLILNGCSTEPIGDEIARTAPGVTVISVSGGILRQAAIRAISAVYSFLLTGMSAEDAAKEATSVLRGFGENHEEVRATGRHAKESIFSLPTGQGKAVYYSCMPRTNIVPRRLPVFDREAQVLDLYTALFEKGPFIGLVGMPGNGKTTIIQAIAARYGWRFSDGIGYISLRTDLALSNLPKIFGWDERKQFSLQEIPSRLSTGRYLLIFDDAEEASPEAVQEIVSLLNGWDTSLGGRAIIAFHTRRPEFEEIIGTNWIPVRGLPTNASKDLMESKLGAEMAVRLLGDDLDALHELCFGHPKTIESTASLLQLGERWSEVKDDLIRLGGQGPLGANDEIMGRVIARLEDGASGVRDLLDAWAVFEDRCTEPAWREVAAGQAENLTRMRPILDQALRVLQGATLIERYDEGGEGRCLMHPLLVSHLRRRHEELSAEKLEVFVHTQLALETAFVEADRYPAEESGNVRRALYLAKRLDMWPEILAYCAAVAGNSDMALVRHGPWPLARDILDLAVEAADHTQDSAQEAQFLLVRGLIEYRLADLEHAEAVYSRAAELSELIGEDDLRLAALLGIGRVQYRMGNFDSAQDIYLLAKSSPGNADALTVANIDHEFGKVRYRQGNMEAARELFQNAEKVREEIGNKRQLARSRHELARVEHAAGNHEVARRLYMQALQAERDFNDPVSEQATLFQLGRLALDAGNMAEAERWLNASAKVTERLSDQIWIAHARYGRALLQWARGDTKAATTEAKAALDEARRLRIGLVSELEAWVRQISGQ